MSRSCHRGGALAGCRGLHATERRDTPDFALPQSTGPTRTSVALLSHNERPRGYILASGRNGTLYTGVTSNLHHRTHEHKLHIVPGFTKDHRVDQLVWFEPHPTMESAIRREKSIKGWRRAWKLQLIEGSNACWRDLSDLL